MGKDGPTAGFYARRSHEIIDSSVCDIQHPLSDKAKDIILDYIEYFHVPVYNEMTGQGLIRHVVTKVGYHTKEIMVIIVSAKPELPEKDRLIQRLKREIPNLKSIILNVNPRSGNVVLGNRNITLFGQDKIEDKLGDLFFEISPLSFYQVNPVQTEVLYNKAIEYADLKKNENVYDLYCGIGTIALFAARKAGNVIGVESESEAVAAARNNASRNNIKNAEFYLGEVEKVVPELYADGKKADVVFIDPPRKGCEEVLLKTLVDMSPSRIIYVSCNPSTLARDLKYLTANGFAVGEVQPVDMFPWTEHVECVIGMQRKDT
jgi:23S rRNA (uracil1939-C5)-methyltransferase